MDYYGGGRLGYYGGGRLGMGDVGPTTFTVGPGGQWSISTASQPTAQSIGDQITQWAAAETIIPGAPNALVAGGAILFLLLMGRKK